MGACARPPSGWGPPHMVMRSKVARVTSARALLGGVTLDVERAAPAALVTAPEAAPPPAPPRAPPTRDYAAISLLFVRSVMLLALLPSITTANVPEGILIALALLDDAAAVAGRGGGLSGAARHAATALCACSLAAINNGTVAALSAAAAAQVTGPRSRLAWLAWSAAWMVPLDALAPRPAPGGPRMADSSLGYAAVMAAGMGLHEVTGFATPSLAAELALVVARYRGN